MAKTFRQIAGLLACGVDRLWVRTAGEQSGDDRVTACFARGVHRGAVACA
jgi:hypothetical protein